MTINSESFFRINMRHLKVMFCAAGKLNECRSYFYSTPRTLMTPSLQAWKRINRSLTSIRSAVIVSGSSRSSKKNYAQIHMSTSRRYPVEETLTLQSTNASIIFCTILVSRNRPFSTVMTLSFLPAIVLLRCTLLE